MGYAWAPQITGLVRGEPKPGQRHRSNGLAICMEAFEERASKSPTLDRGRSHGNVYEHKYDTFKSGTDTWEEMCAEASLYRSKVKLKDGRIAERGLRNDAVIGWATIMKPPPEMVAALNMTTEDVARFCDDGFQAMEKIEPRLFRQENVEADAWHFDEGGLHLHRVGTSKDKNGKYCGNLVDANLCVRINQQWPALMRGMGWPIDDLDLTDWQRMADDDDYREEREAKRKRQGQSVKKYGEQKAADAAKVAAAIVEDANKTATQTIAKAEAVAENIRRKVKAEIDEARQERDQLVTERDQLVTERDQAVTERDQAITERDRAQKDRRATRAALQGDLETWAGLTPNPSGRALLGVLGAAVRASMDKQPVTSHVGELARQMRAAYARQQSRDANPGPNHVEGPTR